MIIAGIDEAGRGAVMGPLVLAGISIEEKDEKKLKRIGAKDSKLLTPKKRESLVEKIEKIAKDIFVIKTAACKIDNYRKQGINLNKFEAIKIADIVNYLKPDKVYIDSPDVNLIKFKAFLTKMIKNKTEIILEHKADNKYYVVGAASIIAKVNRDKAIEKIKEKYGEIGSGYSSDPRTIEWMKKWLEKNKEFPSFVRKSWVTTNGILNEKKQKSIIHFIQKILKPKS